MRKTKRSSGRPPGSSPPKFVGVLKDWKIFAVPIYDSVAKLQVQFEYIVSPQDNVYRHAHTWEAPTLVIDSPILPAQHHIRLVRVDGDTAQTILRKMRNKART